MWRSRSRREAVENGGAQLLRLERDRAAVLSQDPRGERLERAVRRLEDAVDERAGIGQGATDPPGGVALNADPGDAAELADLPWTWHAMRVDVEVGRKAEVAFAPGREPDVGADARDAEGADRVAVEVVSDHVPDTLVQAERVRIDLALGLALAGRRPVAELDRPLLRDRRLELREAAGELG